jgi:hydroxyacylglutathione hydrolase
MLIERSLHPHFLSNTYLVAAQEGGEAFFVDAGGPLEPLFEAVDRLSLNPTHVLLTHHHFDHVCEVPVLTERWPGLDVLIHPAEADLVETATATMEAGPLQVAGLEVELLHTPGHTAGMLSVLVDGHVFTGDTLFRGSVGGVRAPGHTTYEDLKRSIMDTLLALPPDTEILPGHTDATTVARELEENPFVRVWRGLDPEGSEPCTAMGEPATLVLLGDDYDGGKKAWVRWPDGRDDIVPGSQIGPAS